MSPGKGLVLDANVLIHAVLGKRVRSILEKYEDSAEVYTPDVCFEEARDLPAILESRGIERHSGLAVLREIELLVRPVDRELYQEHERARVIELASVISTGLSWRLPYYSSYRSGRRIKISSVAELPPGRQTGSNCTCKRRKPLNEPPQFIPLTHYRAEDRSRLVSGAANEWGIPRRIRVERRSYARQRRVEPLLSQDANDLVDLLLQGTRSIGASSSRTFGRTTDQFLVVFREIQLKISWRDPEVTPAANLFQGGRRNLRPGGFDRGSYFVLIVQHQLFPFRRNSAVHSGESLPNTIGAFVSELGSDLVQRWRILQSQISPQNAFKVTPFGLGIQLFCRTRINAGLAAPLGNLPAQLWRTRPKRLRTPRIQATGDLGYAWSWTLSKGLDQDLTQCTSLDARL
jgi:hypothetical protein